jgi:penicillin amidase
MNLKEVFYIGSTSTVLIILMMISVIYPSINVILDPIHGVANKGASDLPKGSIYAPGIPGEAVVIWDPEGVPHIYATTDEIGFYAIGYITASLRLFQMDLFRRIPQGTLAELVGSAGLSNDILIKTLGIHEAIKKSWILISEHTDPDLRRFSELVRYYVRGINDYIARIDTASLPPEYRLLGLKPEMWKPEDVIAIEKLLTMMLAWDTDDLVLNELVRRWGLEILIDLDIINRSRTTPQAYCSEAVRWGDVTGSEAYQYLKEDEHEITYFQSPSSKSVLKIFSNAFFYNILQASNNFIIKGSYTTSGKPIVANDPHLALIAPSLWMLIHIDTPSIKSAGVTVPGSPLVIIGRNKDVAWGFTNVMGDFVDFYYYKWDGNKYFYKDKWLEPKIRREIIKIWDPFKRSFNFTELKVLETIHGPVLEKDGEKFAVSFTGSEPSLEVVFIWKINRAKNVVDALKAQAYFTAPVQNFVVADSQGNIAYSPIGAYPIRANLPIYKLGDVKIVNRGFLPFNGSVGEGEWRGYINYSQLPILYNPPRPFIATANSKPFDGECGLHIGWNWADRFREERIISLLDDMIKSKEKIDVKDVMKIQTDNNVDLGIISVMNILINLIRETYFKQKDLVDELEKWIKEEAPMRTDRWEPSIALTWSYLFHREIWRKLYGEESEAGFLRIEYLENLLKLYLNKDPRAYRYFAKDEVENIAKETLSKALDILRSYYKSDDYKSWLYGKYHYYDPEHPILKSYSYDKIEAGGGPYSINPAMPAEIGSLGAPVRGGASVRLISDLATSKIYVALPGGNNGNPYSEYYENHYKKYWVKKDYYVIDLETRPETLYQLIIRGK